MAANDPLRLNREASAAQVTTPSPLSCLSVCELRDSAAAGGDLQFEHSSLVTLKTTHNYTYQKGFYSFSLCP